MNCKAIVYRSMFTLTTVAIGSFGARPLNAQNAVATLREQIVGTWSVTSQFMEQNGQTSRPFGPNPKGIVVYDNNGRFVGLIQNGNLPNFASGNRMSGSDDENRAVVQGAIAYYGKYSIDEKASTMTLHFDGCTFPNWDGQAQSRSISFSGNNLNITIPISSTSGVGHIVLTRVK